jgi:tetratricopeptide (TPR) repeat protein
MNKGDNMNFSEKQIEFFEKLEKYYRKLEETIGPRAMPCGTCIKCCCHLINYLHSPLEVDYINYYLIKRGNPDNLPIFSWEEHIEKSSALCVYCDQVKKACTAYEARFNICRIFGPFITDTDLTTFPGCVYKWHGVHRGYDLNLVPYDEEYKELVKGYLELLSEDVREAYMEITSDAFGQMVKKRYNFAVEYYKKLIDLYPKRSYLYVCLGRVYRNLKNLPSAIEYFNKAIEIDPEQELAYLDLGSHYYQEKRLDKSEELLKTALKIEPSDEQAAYALVLCLLKQNKFDEASVELKKLLDLSFQYEERLLKEKELIDLI